MESNGTKVKDGYLDWVLSVLIERNNYSNRIAVTASLKSYFILLDNRGMLSLYLKTFEDNIATVLSPTLHEVMVLLRLSLLIFSGSRETGYFQEGVK